MEQGDYTKEEWDEIQKYNKKLEKTTKKYRLTQDEGDRRVYNAFEWGDGTIRSFNNHHHSSVKFDTGFGSRTTDWELRWNNYLSSEFGV